MDLTILVYATTGFFTLYSIYYFALFLATIRREGDHRECPCPAVKFLVLVPAHNEEDVISDICRDLLSQRYPRGLFRALVIADNCEDRTAKIVGGMECATLRLVERRSEVRGKGAALDYALENMRRYIGDFRPDYVVVFDADNRVPVDFLDELSSRVGGHAALQCNVKTKNPNSSLIARASYYEGLILQRLWQHGKDRMGLCTALAGTGEAIRYDLISTLGFGNSLTDDLDLTIRLAERGLKVKYLHYPCTYDEKPDSLRVEIRRRTRWAAGHFQTFFRHGARLLSIPSRLSLDAFFYLTNIISPIVVLTSWFA
ncbi:MAG: glycosyltransferase [Candidatus Verstraetearchaeota archaeon]|nr:glycosyltransferase [Candidatus Verstraetearchaeota archaeon]